MIRQIINNVPFLDTIELFHSISKIPTERKLSHLLHNSGVEFYDPKTLNFVKKASVSIVGIGGLSFDLSSTKSTDKTIGIKNSNAKLKFSELTNIFQPLQAVGGYMSYLNVGNLQESEMVEKMTEYKHFSTLHLSYINIAIFGISSLVENEINCQRDSIHISRITEARTNVQVEPPLVVHYEEQLETAKIIRDFVKHQKSLMFKPEKMSTRDYYESTNSFYPASKATGVIISLTLKNLRKFVDLLGDNGKEEELKKILASINDFSHILWPNYFQSTEEYGYKKS